MALNVTLLDLRNQSKVRADLERSKFVEDSDWDTFINSGYAELYDLLVAKANDRYTVPATITVNGTSPYAIGMPSNFYMLVGIDYSLGGNSYPMDPFVFIDRHSYRDDSIIRYRLVGSNLMFVPTPPAQSFTLWHVPAITKLVDDADTLDGVNGWEDFIVVSAAIKGLVKEESDPSALILEKKELTKRIENMGANRDQGRAERVTDVSNARVLPLYGTPLY